jgi:hypothetical protein
MIFFNTIETLRGLNLMTKRDFLKQVEGYLKIENFYQINFIIYQCDCACAATQLSFLIHRVQRSLSNTY